MYTLCTLCIVRRCKYVIALYVEHWTSHICIHRTLTIVHCTVYTYICVHCTMYNDIVTLGYLLYYVYIYVMFNARHTMQWHIYTTYDVLYTTYNVQCTTYNTQRTIYGVHIVRRTIYDVQYTSYNVWQKSNNARHVHCTNIIYIQYTCTIYIYIYITY